jgi:hypothetical protein
MRSEVDHLPSAFAGFHGLYGNWTKKLKIFMPFYGLSLWAAYRAPASFFRRPVGRCPPT